jgi:hypothetical protein
MPISSNQFGLHWLLGDFCSQNKQNISHMFSLIYLDISGEIQRFPGNYIYQEQLLLYTMCLNVYQITLELEESIIKLPGHAYI